ncbi:MAG: PAS domain-containing protein, partial [Alphaproteobacteria bacterium]
MTRGWIAGTVLAALSIASAPCVAATVGTAPSSTLLLTGWGLALGIGALCAVLIIYIRKAQRRAVLDAAALDALDDAVLLCDRAGRSLAANAKWRARFGDGAGLDVLQARLDDMGPLSRLRVAIAAGDSGREDVALLDGDGRKSWSMLAVNPASGIPGAALWRLGDAATRNALDSAIAAQFDGLVGFLDDFPLGCAVVAEDGTFRQANTSFAQWLGTTPEALVGDGVRLADIVEDPRPADASPWRALPAEEGAGGCAVGELAFKDGYGRRFIVQLSQVSLDEGGVPASLLLVRDVSGEHDLAAALRHAETRFHRFFDEAPFGIALVDPEGRISECSKAFDRMVSAGPGSASGQQLWAYVEDNDRDRLRHWFVDAATGDEGMPLQITFSKNVETDADADDESAVAVSLFAGRYDAEDGAPGGVVVHALDQTEQRSIENQFFQSQKMELVGQLAGGIAHDFNNLLTAMIGFCDLLLQRHSPKDQSFADIMQIKQNANRAANLVRQLLAFSRQQTLQPRVLDITDVLAELTHLLRRLIGANVELEMVHSRDLGPVKVDQSQLEQVIINLVVNARDAIGDGGKLAIRTRNIAAGDVPGGQHQPLPLGDYVMLEVEDDGCGIAREH